MEEKVAKEATKHENRRQGKMPVFSGASLSKGSVGRESSEISWGG